MILNHFRSPGEWSNRGCLDCQQAMKWFNKAADAGNADAVNNIELMYEEGKGVKKDMKKATGWRKKSNATKIQSK